MSDKNLIEKLNDFIENKQPNSAELLYAAARNFLSETTANIKLIEKTYFGYKQGAQVVIRLNNKQYTLPGRGMVYSVFK